MKLRRSVPIVLCAALAACIAVLGVAAPPASGATPCWRRLIDDWYDGRIDKTYSAACYREAQKHIPTDASTYSSLPDDLDRALATLIGGGGPVDPDTPVPAGGNGRHAAAPTTATTGSSQEQALANGDDKRSPLDKLAPANADSIPIPLLVLAGLALLLLAAAAASYGARWVQGRRAAMPAGPAPRRPRS
jgi:hypothetical protein